MLTNLETIHTPEAVDVDEAARPIRKLRRYTSIEADATPLHVPSRAQRLYAPLRRVLDFALALVILVLAAPVMALAAVVVRLTSRGPAFYTQIRTGLHGKPFTIFKIRTMVDKCESLTGPRWTIPGDPRITPIGWLLRKTHIDELPQLLNVLRGDMSLIGPRPERPEFVQELEKAVPGYPRRHAVLPGITGLAQVQLAPDTDLESVRSKLVYDLYFVCQQSLWLDFRILLATGLHILGFSFERLRNLRVVPRVEAQPMQTTAETPTPRLRKQAA
jgi:lipopolysaccharide/colanic/teichoic acid biosynthesis glycosyltransferase